MNQIFRKSTDDMNAAEYAAYLIYQENKIKKEKKVRKEKKK